MNIRKSCGELLCVYLYINMIYMYVKYLYSFEHNHCVAKKNISIMNQWVSLEIMNNEVSRPPFHVSNAPQKPSAKHEQLIILFQFRDSSSWHKMVRV